MLSLIERNIAAIEERLVVVAPEQSPAPECFTEASTNKAQRRRLIREMQRLRGSVYLQDGAVQRDELTTDGRHCTPQDERSWHLLMLDGAQQMTGCIWYLEHDMPATPGDLRVDSSPLANEGEWRPKIRRAVESDIARAGSEGLPYAEVGGWAVSQSSQCPAEGFLLAMAAYSLSRVLGGAIGLTTATVRHSSARILRRLGLSRFEADGVPTPAYFDPKYQCEMELLRFDSRETNPKYHYPIELLKKHLTKATLVAAIPRPAEERGVLLPAFARREKAA